MKQIRSTFEELKSILIEEKKDKRIYKIALCKWKKGIKKISEGYYISIERHDGRPNSLNKEEISWFRSQNINFSNKDTIDKLIEKLQEYSKLLESEQIKSKNKDRLENLNEMKIDLVDTKDVKR